MFSHRFVSLAAGIFFLLIALGALYRLFWFVPIEVAGVELRAPFSFFAFVIFAALSLIAFKGMRGND